MAEAYTAPFWQQYHEVNHHAANLRQDSQGQTINEQNRAINQDDCNDKSTAERGVYYHGLGWFAHSLVRWYDNPSELAACPNNHDIWSEEQYGGRPWLSPSLEPVEEVIHIRHDRLMQPEEWYLGQRQRMASPYAIDLPYDNPGAAREVRMTDTSPESVLDRLFLFDLENTPSTWSSTLETSPDSRRRIDSAHEEPEAESIEPHEMSDAVATASSMPKTRKGGRRRKRSRRGPQKAWREAHAKDSSTSIP